VYCFIAYIVNTKLFMNTSELTALLALTTAASFTPGPNTTLSTALAANYGLKRAMTFVCAVPVGWGLLFSLCAGGVGALVVAMPALRLAIKVLGVGYLLWLAYKIGMANTSNSQLSSVDESRLKVTFFQGVMLQFLNIKAWMLALALVAGWIAGKPDAPSRFLMMFPILLFYAFASNLTYAAMGSLLREWLQVGNRLAWFNRFMAAILAVTAAWMATF
jgi:threonine/homoserine/homoserine lactone efflux protein